MKNIKHLITDINAVISGNGGWDATITNFFSEEIKRIGKTRLEEKDQRDYIGLSSLGFPCYRKLWYRNNHSNKAEELSPEALGTFLYGDILEALLLSLAKASGHEVECEQEEVSIRSIKGHLDCIIDGMVVDIKSVSGYGASKFRNNGLRKDDPFGYISQLSSYLYSKKDDPKVIYKTQAAFLAIEKERFKLHLDIYDFSKELETKEKEVEEIEKMVASKIIPPRLEDIPQSSTSPNRKLCTTCSYCEFKYHCWPGVRTFIYSADSNKRVEHLTKVVKTPNVTEVIK